MKIVEVRINGKDEKYVYDDLNLKKNLTVIVKNEKGLHFGQVVGFGNSEDNSKYNNVIRIATKRDYNQHLKNLEDTEKAISKCKKLIDKNSLNMTIVDAYYNFDRSQLLFRFLSDERVDFRNLAKELGSQLKTRIELRQIGVRDKAKEVGGFGPCGRLLCCSTFLNSFDAVSINMAKNQGLALNPTKINGSCGRLLCCLTYENDNYIALKKLLPSVGSISSYGDKQGKVISIDVLNGSYKILTTDNEVVVVNINESKK